MAKLTDRQLLDKLTDILLKLCTEEGRITNLEANRILFYGMYNNSCVTRSCDDMDENCCEISP